MNKNVFDRGIHYIHDIYLDTVEGFSCEIRVIHYPLSSRKLKLPLSQRHKRPAVWVFIASSFQIYQLLPQNKFIPEPFIFEAISLYLSLRTSCPSQIGHNLASGGMEYNLAVLGSGGVSCVVQELGCAAPELTLY